MMLPIAWVLLALGFTFVLGEAPWFRRAGVVDRLAPYRRHRPTDPTRRTSESIRAVLAPGIERWGERASSMLGVRQQLSTRLEQAGWSVDPTSFRMRQAAFAGVTFVAGAAFTVALTPRPVVAVVAIVGLPLLAALIEERRLDSAVEERRSRRQEELPVVTEQLGLLLSAGYSVPSALNRLAQRGDGTIASDLRAVSRRIRQGLSTNAALAEWADDSGVDAIGRLVAVLRLHDDAGDLAGSTQCPRSDAPGSARDDRAAVPARVGPGDGRDPPTRPDLPGGALHLGHGNHGYESTKQQEARKE